MKYYELTFDDEHYKNYVPEGYNHTLLYSFDGRSNISGWVPLVYMPAARMDHRPIPDFISGGRIPIVSESAYHTLSSICEDCVEFLPCYVGKKRLPYYTLNVLGREDCLDRLTSTVVCYPGSNRIMDIVSLSICRLNTTPIFRIKELPLGVFFVTEDFADILRHSGLTGFILDDSRFMQ